jgi:hypothetical protein
MSDCSCDSAHSFLTPVNMDSVVSVVEVHAASIFSVIVNSCSLLELYVLQYVLYKKEILFKLSGSFSQRKHLLSLIKLSRTCF